MPRLNLNVGGKDRGPSFQPWKALLLRIMMPSSSAGTRSLNLPAFRIDLTCVSKDHMLQHMHESSYSGRQSMTHAFLKLLASVLSQSCHLVKSTAATACRSAIASTVLADC